MLFFYVIFLVALFCSPALLTISMVGLAAVAVFDIQTKPWRIGWNRQFFKNLSQLRRPDYLAIMAIFFIVFLSGFNSEALDFWGKQVRLKIPFLLLPIIFVNLPKLREQEFKEIIYAFLIIASVAALGTMINYALDYAYITERIHNGTPIPTPIHHIRFSLLIVFAVVCGIWLRYSAFTFRYDWEKHLISGISLFLFLVVHILSVKSGLVALYAVLGLMAFYYITHAKRFWLFAIIFPVLILLPIAAYYAIPALKNKIDYFKYDVDMFTKGNRDGFSDGQRIASLDIGWMVFKENLVFGTGFGDLKEELNAKYAVHYPNLPPKMPHNQFLLFGAATGCVGLLAFLIAFLTPLFYQKRYRFVLFATFYVLILLSFMFENTLSTAVGTGIYLIFLLLMMQREKNGLN
jgi:O-antigen ligase